MGFLRLATNAKVLPTQALTQTLAWDVYDRLLAHPRVGFENESPGIDTAWRGLARPLVASKVWNDAYLAAFAIVGGYEVITFDQGFSQLTGCPCTILS
jgi:hypothetical protein